MAIDISGAVSGLVRTALDAASLRHETISNNIANINTPGYKLQKVNFESQLQALMQSGEYKDDASLKQAMHGVEPMVYESDEAMGANQLDVEMVNLAKNTIQYEALLSASRNYGSIVKLAVKEGK